MQKWSIRTNRWVVWLRLEQAIWKEKRALICQWMTADNQNEILATLIGTAMKPRYWQDENWVWHKVTKKELISEVQDDMNQLDAEIAYLSDLQHTPYTV